MLPQLATSTFPSQVFWVILGFVCVYIFMSGFAVPKLKKVLDRRNSHIDKALKAAETLRAESEKLEKDAEEALAKVQREALSAEKTLMDEFDLKNQQEKQKLDDKMSAKVKKEIDSLKISSQDAFEKLSSDLDEILDLAMDKIKRTNNVHS